MNGILRLTGSYSFIDKDPAVGLFQSLRKKETKLSDKDLAVIAKLHFSTVKKMFNGETMKPAHLTLQKLAIALNHRWELVPSSEPLDYDKVLPKAWEVYHEHEAALKAKRERAAKRPRKKRGGNGK